MVADLPHRRDEALRGLSRRDRVYLNGRRLLRQHPGDRKGPGLEALADDIRKEVSSRRGGKIISWGWDPQRCQENNEETGCTHW